MTLNQIGKLRHGVYGYPVIVEAVVAAGEAQISLAGVTAINLSLGRILVPPSKRTSISRALVVLDTVLSAGTLTTPPLLKWIVQPGDIPVGGTYLMELTFEIPDKHLVLEGNLLVE